MKKAVITALFLIGFACMAIGAQGCGTVVSSDAQPTRMTASVLEISGMWCIMEGEKFVLCGYSSKEECEKDLTSKDQFCKVAE